LFCNWQANPRFLWRRICGFSGFAAFDDAEGSVIKMASINPDEKTDLATWLEMVERLRHAPEWPKDELPIEMKQTHISVLLLSRNYVVKLKKPVDFGFLDYTTLNKRLKACEDEIRLNRRLCTDTYIGLGGVIDLDGQIRFSGKAGKIVDHCVWMKRLPEDRMLDRMVANNTVTEAVIDSVAARLCEFHAKASRGTEIARWGSLDEVRHNWEENFTQTEPFIGRTISAPDYEAIRSWAREEMGTKAGLFDRRAREGRVVDGHGDVRCESVCVRPFTARDDAICIYDCIEFNDRFRCGDVAGEAAFLAMDLDARGRPDLGYFFTEAYQRRTGDEDFFTLLPFYRCYRAYVRGKVLSFRLNESEFSKEEREDAATRAKNFFDLARRYASRLKKPTVIAVGGLSGTGKTAVARAFAGELGLQAFSSDAARQSLFGDAKKRTAYGEGAYTAEANCLTYRKLIEAASEALKDGRSVVLDATFREAEALALARSMAAEAGARWRLIECRLAPELVSSRLAERAARKEGLSDATWEIYLRQREEGASLKTEPDACHLILDTSGSLAATSRMASDWLRDSESRQDLQDFSGFCGLS
jgi:aminoglycoside phosphotransferase family enzyme/predicted kinase